MFKFKSQINDKDASLGELMLTLIGAIIIFIIKVFIKALLILTICRLFVNHNLVINFSNIILVMKLYFGISLLFFGLSFITGKTRLEISKTEENE